MDKSFWIGGLEIHYYALILVAGMLCALMLFLYLGKKRQLSSEFVLTIFLWAIISGLLGARLFYVVPRPEYWESWEAVGRIFTEWAGITIIGGIIVGACGVLVACLIHKKSPFRVTDTIAPCLLLAQVIGRWGNFINQELYGVEITAEWAQVFPLAVNINGVWHAASFFYEMCLNAVGFILAMIVFFKWGEKLKPGVMTLAYFIWYGLVRGCLEFIKVDPLTVNGVRVVQTICFCAVPIAIILLVLLQKGKIKLETEKMYMQHFNLAYEPPPYEGDNE